MKVWVQKTGREIAPFGDPIGETLIANRPLSAWQDEMLASFDVIPTLQPPCLVVPDTLFTTAAVLERFVERAGGKNAVLVLATSLFGESTTPVQPEVEAIETGYRFSAIRFDDGSETPPHDVVLDPEEERFELNAPELLGLPEAVGLAKYPVMTLHHWVHILWANQAAGALEVRTANRFWGALRILWAVIRARSINKWKVLAKLNTIGKNCDIHPSAIIEGSTLGDNVTVGPNAHILFSRIGDGAAIMSGAEVEASTIGPKAIVAQRAGVRLSVLYPGAFTSQVIIQTCVLGRNVFTTPGSFSIDLNFDGDIRVPLDGALHTTKSRFLGSAFGHDTRMGTGVWLASGRAIPNNSFVVGHPDGVVQRVPEQAAEGPMVNDRGALVPLHPDSEST